MSTVITRTRTPSGCPRARLVIALGLLWLGACRAEPTRYGNLYPDARTAAQAVVDAMAAHDFARLEVMAVTAVEFRKYIWPKLPTSRPEVNMPVDYVWTDTDRRSRANLSETLAEYGGRPWIVADVRFTGTTTDYGTFRLHRDSRVTLRDRRGQTHDVRLFGSMIATSAGWKVYSYIVD